MELYLQCACATLVLLFLAFGVPRLVNGLADSLARKRTTTTTFKLPTIIVPLEMPEVKPIKEEKAVIHKVTVTQEEMREMIYNALEEKKVFNDNIGYEVKKVSEIFSGETKGSFEIEVEVND